MTIKVTNAEHAQIIAALRAYSDSQRAWVQPDVFGHWEPTQRSVDIMALANRIDALDPADDGPEVEILRKTANGPYEQIHREGVGGFYDE